MERKIIDLSGWNENLKYTQLKDHDIVAAILRVTEKNNKKDSLFDTHVKNLKENNIPFLGVYKFSYATNLDEIQTEAIEVINTLKQYPDFDGKVVYLDLQYPEQKRLSSDTITEFIRAFQKIIIENGYKFGIYCNTDWYDNVLDINNLDYDYWLAAYPYSDNGEIVQRIRPQKKNQIGWQYTSNFAINKSLCDMSVFDQTYINSILDINFIQWKSDSTDNTTNIIENAISFMERIARDESHGYSQDSRWGSPDYDCSSLVISSWEQAGVPVKTAGATYTGNMYDVFLKNGFIDVTNQINLQSGSGLMRGDVLLNHVHHTAMYCGNGFEVQASINEKGTAHNSIPGDQTGREILIRSYRNYPWDAVLRYANGENKFLVKKGAIGTTVSNIQKMLITCGYSCGSYGMDGQFGSKTEAALKAFQKDFGLEVDGIYGEESQKILQAEYKKYPKKVKVVKKGYIREGAGVKQPVIKTVKIGSTLTVIKKIINKGGGKWYELKDNKGFINANRVQTI